MLYGQNSCDVATILDFPVIISLGRHMERYEETYRLMEQAGFTNIRRFEAIDGYFTKDEFFKKLNIQAGMPGQKGCTASHLVLWKRFVEDPAEKEFLFVCEDDMLPHSDFPNLFPLYWEVTPKDFDILMVGNELIEKIETEDLIITIPAQTTHAYIISKNGAKQLLDLYQKIPQNSDGLDFIIDVFIRKMMQQKKIIFYCYNGKKYPDNINQEKIVQSCNTGICFQNLTFNSTISIE